MSDNHSITRLLPRVKSGDEQAIHDLFLRCYRRIAESAEKKLRGASARTFDADDITSTAFTEFLSRAASGSFPKLECRSDVWQILLMLVGDAVKDKLRYEYATKRGGKSYTASLNDVGNELLAMDDSQLTLEIDEAMKVLPSEEQRQLATLLMEGWTQQQIATRLNVSVRTVQRKCDDVRVFLMEHMGYGQ